MNFPPNTGTLCLHTEKIKLALCTEAKSWRVAFGRAMNTKYQSLMEEVSGCLEDWLKRLSRPLNDLDDIREVMAALKEIRENEIRIDMSLEPIEVCTVQHASSYTVSYTADITVHQYVHDVQTNSNNQIV